MLTRSYSLFLFLICLILSSCENPGGTTNNVPNAITGEVRIRDVDLPDSEPELTNRAGVKVWLQGTNISSVTDASGKYTMNGVPPGLYVLVAAREGLDTLTVNVEYSGVGIDFVPPLHMYTLTKGRITLDPILRMTARELYRHPNAAQMQIIDSINSNGDTTYSLRGQIHLVPNDTVVVFTGIESLVSVDERPLIFGTEDSKDQFNGNYGAFKDGDRYFRFYYPHYLDDFVEAQFQNNPPQVRLYSYAVHQKVWSNPQSFPVK